jgi:hypothetical protein
MRPFDVRKLPFGPNLTDDEFDVLYLIRVSGLKGHLLEGAALQIFIVRCDGAKEIFNSF